MKTGTIVLTRFPYTDLTSSKRRPTVVLYKVNPHDPDVIVGFISSVMPATLADTDFVLDKTHADFASTGLKIASIFKMDKLATLDSSIFTGALGDVSPTILADLKVCLRKALDL
jgi:mRNA interferase MazF